jgi:hypothetical protein
MAGTTTHLSVACLDRLVAAFITSGPPPEAPRSGSVFESARMAGTFRAHPRRAARAAHKNSASLVVADDRVGSHRATQSHEGRRMPIFSALPRLCVTRVRMLAIMVTVAMSALGGVVPFVGSIPFLSPATASASTFCTPFALIPGQTLTSGQCMVSPNGAYDLYMQSDGNLVEYRVSDARAIWFSGTANRPAHVVMQTDGNLVVYGSAGYTWASWTQNNPSSMLYLQNDGNLVIRNPAGTALWTSGTSAVPSSTQMTNAVAYMKSHWYWQSNIGRCEGLVNDAYQYGAGYRVARHPSALADWIAQVTAKRAHVYRNSPGVPTRGTNPGYINAPYGSFVFFRWNDTTDDWKYGHVGISLGNGTYISWIKPGIRSIRSDPYLGWSWVMPMP